MKPNCDGVQLHVYLACDHVGGPACHVAPVVTFVGVDGDASKVIIVVLRGWKRSWIDAIRRQTEYSAHIAVQRPCVYTCMERYIFAEIPPMNLYMICNTCVLPVYKGC